MIDERHEELASLHALDLLEGAERATFEADLAREPALQALVRDLRESAATLAHTAPTALPPPELKQRILASLSRPPASAEVAGPWAAFSRPYLPWAVAACFALLGAWLAQLYIASRSETALARDQRQLAEIAAASTRQQLEAERIVTQRQLSNTNQQLAEAQQQLADITRAALDSAKKLADAQRTLDESTQRALATNRDLADAQTQIAALQAQADLAKLKIAALVAMTNNAPPAVAVAVWNPARQEGVFQAEKMPLPAANRKYELWVLEDNKAPVSAGVFNVTPDGATRVNFKPTAPIAAAAMFAVSSEKDDGARVHAKPDEVLMVIK